MTIDDELLLELIKPKLDGKVGENALIAKVVGLEEIRYTLEHSETYSEKIGSGRHVQFEPVKITPDVVIKIAPAKSSISQTKNGGLVMGTTPAVEIAVEIENDIHWDFQESLRQLRKYKGEYPDTRVIIPTEFERFAPLYRNEGFRVYLWKAKRRWQCLKCGTETMKEGPITPICSNSECKNHNQNEFRLIGLKNADIKEYT